MDKLFEKAIIFMTLIIFIGFSYIVFNYNEIKFKDNEDKYSNAIELLELEAPDWFRETIKPFSCNDFSVIRLEDRFYIKCVTDKKTIYIRKNSKHFPFKSGYLYKYESDSNILKLYVKIENEKVLIEKKYDILKVVNQDFLNYLKTDLKSHQALKYESNFLMIKDIDNKNYIMVK